MDDQMMLLRHMISTVVTAWTTNAMRLPSPSSLNLYLQQLLSYRCCVRQIVRSSRYPQVRRKSHPGNAEKAVHLK